MKKHKLFILSLIICLTLCSCGVEEQNIEINFGESKTIELKRQPENAQWESADERIATVVDNVIKGVGPGSTTISATENGKKIVNLSVSVNLIDITSVLFCEKNIEIEENETKQLKYLLLPENASDYGLTWTSANTEIVEVDASGYLHGIAPGTTTIIIASPNGAMDTCAVTVKAPSAIEQLNNDEKLIFDYMTNSMLNSFYNASAARIRKIYNMDISDNLNEKMLNVILDIQGTNRLGGTLYKKYGVFITKSTRTGVSLECGENPDLSHPADDDIISAAKINAALEEYWSDNHY